MTVHVRREGAGEVWRAGGTGLLTTSRGGNDHLNLPSTLRIHDCRSTDQSWQALDSNWLNDAIVGGDVLGNELKPGSRLREAAHP